MAELSLALCHEEPSHTWYWNQTISQSSTDRKLQFCFHIQWSAFLEKVLSSLTFPFLPHSYPLPSVHSYLQGYVSLQVIFHPFQTPSPVYWVVVHTVTLKQGRRCPEELDVGSPSCSWGSTQVRWSIYALSNSKADHFFTGHLQNNRPRTIKYHSY